MAKSVRKKLMAKSVTPRFDVDEHVFVRYKGSVLKAKVVAIIQVDGKFQYFIFGIWYNENEVYRTFEGVSRDE